MVLFSQKLRRDGCQLSDMKNHFGSKPFTRHMSLCPHSIHRFGHRNVFYTLASSGGVLWPPAISVISLLLPARATSYWQDALGPGLLEWHSF